MTGRLARTVVLDDDPTGTQSASGVTVLFQPDPPSLVEALTDDSSVYVQTNSRSLDEAQAVRLASDIRASAGEAGRRLGVAMRFVLRGDSTLRGHVFAESEVFLREDSVLLFVPAFPDGGRRTRGGVHTVDQDGQAVPVGETEFARDPVFSFDTSDLVRFTTVRSGRETVLATLDDVRSGRLTAKLVFAPTGSVVLADAVETADIRHIARAVEVARASRDVVVRSAAPLAAELAGVASDGLLDPTALGTGKVLVVCGSHTDGARQQVACLAELIGSPTIVETASALVDPLDAGHVAAVRERTTNRQLDVRFLATERDRSPAHAGLDEGAHVMASLVSAARDLAVDVDIVVTKGGITASDVVRHSLGATHARVLGQLQVGVSVWRVTGFDGRTRPCVIVPGNMGAFSALADIVAKVTERGTSSPQRV